MLSPEMLAQGQLEAYNRHDLAAFLQFFAEDIQVFRPPTVVPALQGKPAFAEFYGAHRFGLPRLHAQVLHRVVAGNKVVDHERVVGLSGGPDDAIELIVVYEVTKGLISTMWGFGVA